jgi:hypothetical protein
MSQMTELLKSFPEIDDGPSESRLKGVLFFKETRHIPRRPMVYNPGICIVAQGHKIGYLGGQKFRYDASHYLVTSVTMPFECETFASSEEPLRGLYIDIDMAQLHDLVGRLGLQEDIGFASEKGFPRGIGPAVMDKDMADATTRTGNSFSGPLRHPGTDTLFTGDARRHVCPGGPGIEGDAE